jgi:single-stranded DNA-binding protein
MNTYTIHDARLVADAESNVSRDGATKITSFRVADNQPGPKNDDKPARFVKCKIFGARGEQASKLSKGDVVSVTGELRVEKWTDKTGTERFTDVLAVDRYKVHKSETFYGRSQPSGKETDVAAMFGTESDIPF